jgi:hypothetical protein
MNQTLLKYNIENLYAQLETCWTGLNAINAAVFGTPAVREHVGHGGNSGVSARGITRGASTTDQPRRRQRRSRARTARPTAPAGR